jgi:quinolinate synthase
MPNHEALYRGKYMSIDIECVESKEHTTLPKLTEWRAHQQQSIANGDAHAPRHQGAHRADDIPREYALLSFEELKQRIGIAREKLGDRLVILGHHYQRDEIITWADARGDSFKLAQFAAERPQADYIIFCGVHFMAESADILSQSHQAVILPNPAAGCSMADMADIAEVEDCWEQLQIAGLLEPWMPEDDPDHPLAGVIPVTYMNSTAAIKAFCGRNGGIVCTSSNARKVLQWAFARGRRVLFFPDEHLGRNTALDMGINPEDIAVWDPKSESGGLNIDENIQHYRVILWKGFCSTHQRFTPKQIDAARQNYPGVRVIVHPECRHEVVVKADLNGSTEFIIDQVNAAPPGTIWAIGTEINLVKRLAIEHPEQTIFCLDPVVCPCSTMYRIHPAYLCWALESLINGQIINQVVVDSETALWARVALERMLANRG